MIIYYIAIHSNNPKRRKIMALKETVKPRNINIASELMGSTLRSGKKETIASNIIVLSRANNNEWLEFTWGEYREKCRHNPTVHELKILLEFAEDGLLKCENDTFTVRDGFIAKLWDFVDDSLKD